MADIDVEKVLSELTLEEKVSLTAGRDFWHTVPIPRLGVPAIRTSDGPNGVRGTRFFNGTPAGCLPCATALGATFDVDLLRSIGRFLGQEAKAKGAHVLLAPTINIQRSPLGGRGYESFSEDPFLSGTLAGEYCKGVHEEKIITTPKHFVCNDQEHERLAVDSIVTDRALREIYLMPFMLAIKNARPKAVMTAYNKVNGTHAAENPKVLDILRKDWGWEGLLMSDWYGTYSTSEGINAGLDLEMPGPTQWRGAALSHAVTSNKVRQHVLDERARAVLKTIKEAAKSGVVEDAKEGGLNRPEDQRFLRRVAAESIVLLKNETSILPFDKSKTVAVIGPNAKVATYSGGGSASLLPYYTVTPFDGVSSQCGSVRFSQGAYSHKELPLLGKSLRTSDGRPGFDFRAYDKPVNAADRKLLDTLHLTDSYMFVMDYKVPNYTSSTYYVDVEGVFTPEEEGTYEFGLTVQGTGQLFIDGKLIVDNVHDQRPGTAFFGSGTVEEIGSMALEAGKSYKVRVEFGTAPTAKSSSRATVSFGAGGLRVGGCKRIDPEKAIVDAVKLASEVEQVVVFAGLNSDWEGEGSDRPDMDLPPYSDELISKVLDANPKAAIVLQSGTPVTMPWVDKACALVQAWYGGNETGNAIADVLFGDVNPSGKLSLSFPHRLEDNPAFLNYRSERGRVLYGEDIYVGYRFYDKVKRPALFPFGHGLSYTDFDLSDLNVSATTSTISVRVNVSNSGSRAGAEVVQVYVRAQAPSINRPPKELKGFKKVFLEAEETREVQVEMEKKYAISFWDEGRDAWIVEEGEYGVLVGTSSQGRFLEGRLEEGQTWWWTGL
ncbi:hypothetical protein HO133_010226 [Letharia lupina]|uniref:beta-glucosidase n=1 Tax=Letharia lupina TaxID=560253 RepID=A0A8H6CL01_9LECA|nr:uncharacterized protein HO133_010226 [Letharia lupina]KAF6225031.1 hypothetical protein HO133_010226 [Letharia lupina]